MRVFLMLSCCLVACSSGAGETIEDVAARDGHDPPRGEAAPSSSSSNLTPDAGAISRGPADSGVAQAEDCRGGVCPTGFYCGGSSACGSTWRCIEGFTPCSAAAPFLACACDGVFRLVAAGCPGEHAWPAALPMAYVGGPCDVNDSGAASPLNLLDLRYDGRDLSAFEAVQVRVRVLDQWSTEPLVEAASRVEQGSFSFEWAEFADHAAASLTLLTLFDIDEDGRCSDAETVVAPSATNPFDLSAGGIEFTLVPDDVAEQRAPCDRWNDD